MNTYDINSNQYILEKLIGKALLDAAMWTNKKCTPRKPQEPDYVAMLSTKFVKDFFNIYYRLLMTIYTYNRKIIMRKNCN